MQNNKILIVDDEPLTSKIIEKYLKQRGYYVTTVDSAVKGAELLKKENYHIVVTDVNMPEISGLDFLLWIRQNSSSSQVIVMSAFNSSEIKDFVNQNGALNYFDKPVNVKELADFIDFTVKKAFLGNVTDITLFDFIQIVVLSNKQKLIKVTEYDSSESGYLYITSGKIIHAEYNGLTGLDALNKIMSIHNGKFSEINWKEPDVSSVNLNFNLALIKSNYSFKSEENKPCILIVDDDPITPLIIEKFLKSQGFNTVTADSAVKGAELLKKQFFDLIITDLNMPEINGLEFLLWIKRYIPKSKVILMTAQGSNEFKKFANQQGALNYFEKPLDLKKLSDFIKENFKEKGFSGSLEDIDLIEYLRILLISGDKKVISVIDPLINTQGLIYIKEQKIIHAECKNLEGEEAFYEIMKMKSGIFFDVPWLEPKKHTINQGIDLLLGKGEEIKNEIIESEDQTSVVRSRAQFLEKAVEQREALEIIRKEENSVKKLKIYECGVALELVIGKSTKSEVIQIMTKYSKVDSSLQRDFQIIFYDDLSLMMIFDESEILEEINFGETYKGQTSLGVSIGDKLEKAIEIYGRPKTCTIKGAVWDNIAFFSQSSQVISSIRLRNSLFFDNRKIDRNVLTAREIKLIEKPKEKVIEIEPTAPKKTTAKKSVNNSEEKTTDKKAIKKSERKKIISKNIKEQIINDDGSFIGIKIGETDKDKALEIISTYSKVPEFNIKSNSISIKEISFTVKLDKNNTVEQMEFGESFIAETEKGLKIGDNLEKAVEIYGEPKFKSLKSAIWNNIAVFCENSDFINLIRITS